MYTSETITRPDGTKYVQITRIESDPVSMTEDQIRMMRAIEAFGTSS